MIGRELLHVVGSRVQIDLRARDLAMAEQVANHDEVYVMLHQMGRASVTQRISTLLINSVFLESSIVFIPSLAVKSK
jgi:hypothetical protein